jgi:thioredoxin reductase
MLHSWLIPVQRRRRIEFPGQRRDGKLVAPDIASHAQIITPSLLWTENVACNHRVVIVGASDTGKSFLEQLIYHPSLNLRNLFIIAPTEPTNVISEAISKECFSHSELQQLGLTRYATHIPSKVRLIDRQNKLLKLNDETLFSYDFLILVQGLQFSARYLSEELAKLKGVVSFNQHEWTSAKDYLENAMNGSIVVYGRDLQALALVGSLAEHLEPQQRCRIIYVNPGLSFVSEEAFKRVFDYLEQSGIICHFSTRLTSWEKENDQLTHLSFENKVSDDLIQLTCSNLIYADIKEVDYHIYNAIDESALVYDGKLVIDSHFRTNDPHIYAAGPGTKFKSEYRSDWLLEFCDSRETGEKVTSTCFKYHSWRLTSCQLLA